MDPYFAVTATGFIRRKEFEAAKAAFVRDWCSKHGSLAVSHEQAAAIGAVTGNIQVIARAGSGKTATIISRAHFLYKHCRVPLDEMVLLAFNRSAAREVEDRLHKLCGSRPLHVMTFHALAYAVVHPEQNLLSGAMGQGEDEQAFIIGEVLSKMLMDETFVGRVAEVMIAYYQNEEKDHQTLVDIGDESEQQTVNPQRVTLAGNFVKSVGEQRIANFLYLHQLDYKYEKSFLWDGINYRPDFTVTLENGHQVIIEYFGLKGDPVYDKQSQNKREFWSRRPQYVFLGYDPANIHTLGVDGHPAKFRADFALLGASLQPRDMSEVWKEIRPRAIPEFRDATNSFISRARKRGLSTAGVVHLSQNAMPGSRAEALFLSLIPSIYDRYLEELKEREKEDFDGLIDRAAAMIGDGQTAFLRRSGGGDLNRIRFLFIDEFQDFSYLFDRLVAAIRKANPVVQVFCVGDDWQAINGFAGSDLAYFRGFGDQYPEPRVLHISTNYRSTQEIVEAGNILMKGKGRPAVASKSGGGSVVLCDLDEFTLTPIESDEYSGDKITPAVIRLAVRILADGQDVVLLARRNGLPWYQSRRVKPERNESRLEAFLRVVRSHFSEEEAQRISASTTHKYKGLQKTAVVVLDAVDKSYPLIHPTWIFVRSLGDTLESLTAEEQRLIYVALTRAESHLYIITARENSSPFLKALAKHSGVSRLNWASVCPPLTATERLILSVGNVKGRRRRGTLAIKEQLKADGFRWDPTTETWNSSIDASVFTSGALAKRLWWLQADEVTVSILRSDLSVVYEKILMAAQDNPRQQPQSHDAMQRRHLHPPDWK